MSVHEIKFEDDISARELLCALDALISEFEVRGLGAKDIQFNVKDFGHVSVQAEVGVDDTLVAAIVALTADGAWLDGVSDDYDMKRVGDYGALNAGEESVDIVSDGPVGLAEEHNLGDARSAMREVLPQNTPEWL